MLRPTARTLTHRAFTSAAIAPIRPVACVRATAGSWSRHCSTSPKAEEPPAPEEEKGPVVLFEGAKADIVKHLKKVSIGNVALAITTSPVLQYYAGGKGILMSGLFLSFGLGTTAMLTWATATYALSITTIPGREALLIETPTLLGGTQATEVAWAAIGRTVGYHPFATFEAAGSKYYLDELGTMHDEKFMEKLETAINK